MVEYFAKLVEQAPQTALLAYIFWYGLRQLKDDVGAIKARMDCFEKSQHACQLENAKDFATKVELHDVEARVNNIDSRVSRIEGGK
jgi:hypothetical protein